MSISTNMTVEATTGKHKLTITNRIVGTVALVLAYLAIKYWPVSRIKRCIENLYNWCPKELDDEAALVGWESVRRPKLLWFSNRIACLELSLGLVVFALMQRRSVTWCIGVKTSPVESHAWVDIGGKPFGEPEHIEKVYKRILIVSKQSVQKSKNKN